MEDHYWALLDTDCAWLELAHVRFIEEGQDPGDSLTPSVRASQRPPDVNGYSEGLVEQA
ncbi:hypothetical protein [Myxococcus landrumensis]|uniref:Uncharacterized protein n=1 Tax=Myxococcus landrumensis TaxID=2813577 RepID=A0ABX7N974_9BACT|nr:hypothetical protein [Myxococcus landrumus]QSQ15330.1 hypothetical protein JY572_04390 [Myxococcus landrumus]